MALFFPLSVVSIKISRVLPHTSIEIISCFSIFLAYMYGFPVGAFFGFILGAYIWSTAYVISQFILMHLFVNLIGAFVASYFANIGVAFPLAYYFSVGIRDFSFFGLGAMMGNPLENVLQTISSLIMHFIVMSAFIIPLYPGKTVSSPTH